MTNQIVAHRLPMISARVAVGLALSAPVLTWWAIPPTRPEGPGFPFGPYRFPVAAELAIGMLALLVAAASLAGTIRTVRRSRSGGPAVTVGCLACVIGAGVLLAATWRLETAGGDGASIGGGLALLVAPVFVFLLLQCGIACERRVRGLAWKGWRGWSALTVVVTVALYVIPYALD